MRTLLLAAVMCVLFAFAAGAAIDGPLFKASFHHKVDIEPYRLCIADFDKDGINDIGCADYTTDSICILIGKGDADYEAPVFYTIGSSQYDIQAGDINGDTWPDLVVSTWNAVYTLLNDGDGTFGTATAVSTLTNSPQTIRLALVDGDADLDLIVAHNDYAYANLSWWENDGSGTFTLGGEFGVGTYQRGLAVADFDGTTGPDIAVIFSASEFRVLLNDGSGTFTISDPYVLGSQPRGICAADFDGSNGPDIAIARYGNLDVYNNDGNGVFSAGPSTTIAGSGYCLTAADFNGAGGPDVAMADDSVEVLYNNGSGALGSVNRYWVGEENECVAVGDLDMDGYDDLATVGWPGNYDYAPGHVAVLLNPNGDGQFMYPIQSPVGPSRHYPVSLCRSFFDGDAYPDVATVDWWNDSVLVFLGDGAGGFASSFRAQLPAGSRPSEVVAMDVDGLNTDDLIIGHSNASMAFVSVLLSDGLGGFGTATQYSTAAPAGSGLRPVGVYVDLLNNDGSHDIATINYTASTISVLFNNALPPPNTFGAATEYPVQSPVYHSAIDGGLIDNDAFIDLVVLNGLNNCVQVFYNDGSGGYGTSGNIGTGDVYDPYQVCVDDLNGDGFSDIIVGSYDSNEVCVMINNGGSGFNPTAYYYAGFEQYEIGTSDFDVDGNIDIVVLNTESYNFTILFGDGTGNFVDGGHYGIVSDDSEGLAIADFDLDGYPDIAISNYNHDNISVMLNHYTILTDVEETGIVQHTPGAFNLSQNYPNPFNPRTTIAYNLPSKAEVTISVYNMLGQRVKVFHEGMKAAGSHQVIWDGRTNSGQQVATGVYFYQIKAGDYVESKKMVLLK